MMGVRWMRCLHRRGVRWNGLNIAMEHSAEGHNEMNESGNGA